MKKRSVYYKNLLLFDEFFEDDDDFFDSPEGDARYQNYKEVFGDLRIILSGNGTKSFKIPRPKPLDVRWIKPREEIVLGNHKITAGFFYFGTNLPSEFDGTNNFSALIDPSISIPQANVHEPDQSMITRTVDYAKLTDAQRREYVKWHAGGRADKNIYDWFAILFLYGLERRVLVDRSRGIVKQDELLRIRDEVRRILALYGGESAAIRSAYSNFLGYLELTCADRKLYEAPFPCFENGKFTGKDVFSAYINTALFQCVSDGVPVNAELAYYWYILYGGIHKNDTLVRCEDVFKNLFMIRYTETYGKGIQVKKNKKNAVVTYRFQYRHECDEFDSTLSHGRYSKVTTYEQNILDKLKGITSRCKSELALYIGKVAKSGTDAKDMALPPVLWKGDEAAAFRRLKSLTKDKRYIMPVDELKETFFKTVPFSKSSLTDFAYSLETESIAMEPDIISFPDIAGDNFIFHTLENKIPLPRSNSLYRFCRQVSELAVSAYRSCMPAEEPGAPFKWYFPAEMDIYFYERIGAYVALLRQYPPPLRDCINRLKTCTEEDKKYIIKYIYEYILEDCNTSYEAVSVIESLYKGFRLPKEELYSYLYSGGVSSPAAKNAGLDQDKIKQLRKDSDHVYSMLSDIFKDDAAENAAKNAAAESADVKTVSGGSFNFSGAEALFLKTVLSRPEWRREELMEGARRQGLMLDGFIEIVNEASYNEYDEALIEGDETITVNTDIAGMMTGKL